MSPQNATARARDEAIDVARAMAMLGMFVIHAVLVLAVSLPHSGPLGAVVWLCDGRAAATFVMLAGFGVARLAARLDSVERVRTLHRRGAFLGLLGVLNLIIWPGDILRVYGVALWAAPFMLRLSARRRLLLATSLVLIFPVLAALFHWEARWSFDTMTYRGVWEPIGFLRNLLFDGFRPVVPWLSFFLVGTVLAEQDLSKPQVRRWLLGAGALLTVATLVLSFGLDAMLARVVPALAEAERTALIGTGSMPPMPLFVLSAFGTTSVLLGLVLLLTPRLSETVRGALVATGRRALTWYIVHIVVLVALWTAGAAAQLSAGSAMGVGVCGFLAAAWYSSRYRTTSGTLERWLRRWAERRQVTPGERVVAASQRSQ